MEREYNSQEYFNAWKPQGGSYSTLALQAPELIQTVDAMLQQEAFTGQHAFIREVEGEILLEPDIIFHINEDFKKRREISKNLLT